MPNDELSKLKAAAKQSEKQSLPSSPKKRGSSEHPSTRTTRPPAQPIPKSVNGLGIASLVIGVVAVLFCWIPWINVATAYLAPFGLLFGLVGLIVSLIGRKSGVGLPVAGIIVSATALAFAIFVHESVSGESSSDTTGKSEIASNNKAKSPSKPPAPTKEESIIQVRYSSQEKATIGTRLSFYLTNISGKPIKAIKGGIHIYDQFGDKLHGLEVKIDKPLAAGESTIEEGVWPMVSQRTLDLLENNLSDIRLVFRVDKVIYAGTENRTSESGSPTTGTSEIKVLMRWICADG